MNFLVRTRLILLKSGRNQRTCPRSAPLFKSWPFTALISVAMAPALMLLLATKLPTLNALAPTVLCSRIGFWMWCASHVAHTDNVAPTDVTTDNVTTDNVAADNVADNVALPLRSVP